MPHDVSVTDAAAGHEFYTVLGLEKAFDLG